ncbi:MAG TPA: hypothetical protein VF228_25655, partial [Iamia sp.]
TALITFVGGVAALLFLPARAAGDAEPAEVEDRPLDLRDLVPGPDPTVVRYVAVPDRRYPVGYWS